jgi:hypothetical protein
MQVVRDTRASTGPEVHADIDSLGAERSFDHRYRTAEQEHEVAEVVFGQSRKLGSVMMGGDQEMTIVVRVLIQHDTGMVGGP